MKKHSYIIILSSLLLLVLIPDIICRHNEIIHFNSKGWLFYFLSILYFSAATCFLLELLKKIRQRALSIALITLYSFLILSLTFGSLIFYRYFNCLPNSFVFDYMFAEFNDFREIFLYQLSILRIISFLIILSIFSFIFYRFSIHLRELRFHKIRILLSSVYIFPLFFIFNNNVRIFPGCFIPPVNTFFSFSFALQKQLFANGAGIHVLSQPYRSPLPKVKRIPGYNILVILGESSRATSSFAHGYAKATNPFQTEFLKKNNGIIFKRFYSVCTRTMLSFPSFLTGVSPSQSMGLLHRQPTIFNYAKSLDSINTFLISSQSYDWGNFRLFIKDASLDYLYTREDIPFRQTDDMPLQDSILPLILDKHLNSINTPYVGMLQFFITHYPYNSFPQDRIFGNDSLSKYNASTRSLDRIIAKVIDVLKSHKLIDNTIIIFTSDHGEAFNEHGYSGHLHTFYNEEALVPAWLFIPEALIRNDSRLLQSFKNAHANSNLPMSNIDIVPTVMDLLGIWNDNDLSSFRRELTGSPATLPVDTSRVIFMQNYNEVDFNTMFVGIGLVHGRQKYLLHTRNNMLIEELYDIYSNPSEKNNIITLAHSTRLSFFHSQLRKYPATKSLLNKFLNRKN